MFLPYQNRDINFNTQLVEFKVSLNAIPVDNLFVRT